MKPSWIDEGKIQLSGDFSSGIKSEYMQGEICKDLQMRKELGVLWQGIPARDVESHYLWGYLSKEEFIKQRTIRFTLIRNHNSSFGLL